MWTWFLNPKNMILTAVSVALIALTIAFLWQRNTVVSQDGKIKVLTAENQEQKSKIEAYAKDIELQKTMIKNQNEIEKQTANLRAKVEKLKARELTQDEKIMANTITDYINSGLLRIKNDQSTEVLPGPAPAPVPAK